MKISSVFYVFILILTEAEVNGFPRHLELLRRDHTDRHNSKNSFREENQFYKPKFNLGLSNSVSRSILELAYKIGAHVMSDTSEHFVVFSPLSIATALSLLMLGSDGQTNAELMSLFGFDKNTIFRGEPSEIHDQFGLMIEDLLRNIPHPERIRPVDKWKYKETLIRARRLINRNENQHKIEIANGVFVQKDVILRKEYRSTVERVYRGEIQTVDFKENSDFARQLINDWAKTKTNGRIHEILAGGIPAKTNMILANALYFKALWENPFFTQTTTKRHFYPNGYDDIPVEVDTMYTVGSFPFYDAKEYGCKIIGLPYKGNQTTMYIVLPEDSTKQKLRLLQFFLTPDKINEIISKMSMTTANLHLPKMHFESSLDLKNILESMGVHSLFSKSKSDLSQITARSEEFLHQDKEDPNLDTLEFKLPRGYEAPVLFPQVDNSGNLWRNKDFYIRVKSSLRQYRSNHQKQNSIGGSEQDIFVNDILHKADLTINEAGTEGGATTTMLFPRSDLEYTFDVNKPFLFFIRHDSTKLPLFYGAVYNPVT